MEINLDQILECTEQLARSSGLMIKKARDKGSFAQELKGGTEPVTEVDRAVDAFLIKELSSRYPQHSFLTEETAPRIDQEIVRTRPVWIIDPIDGTRNFARGFEYVAVSIALSINGVVELGVVHNPFLEQTFHAVRGGGAFLNGAQIRVSAITAPQEAIIGTGFPYTKEDLRGILERASAVLQTFADIRRCGSAALDVCSVACGKLDGYYERLNPWDMAAAALIAREAGAVTGSFDSESSEFPSDLRAEAFIAGNPAIFAALQRAINQGSRT